MPRLEVKKAEKLSKRRLRELCEAAELAIEDSAGFGWVRAPDRDAFERYWRGVVMVPERTLFVAQLDGVIAGSVQLVSAPPQKEAWALACLIDTHFVTPWARGHGLARLLMQAAEDEARSRDLKVVNLSVRETQEAAIKLYEGLGFERWGRHPLYAIIDGKEIAGLYYCKRLEPLPDDSVSGD